MTPKREKRFRDVINKRQKDLTVILEDVHDGHNISAILRTCDSIGVQEVYVIFTDDISLPFFLNKPSCTQFYIPGHIVNGWTENKFINQLEKIIPISCDRAFSCIQTLWKISNEGKDFVDINEFLLNETHAQLQLAMFGFSKKFLSDET